MFDAEAIARALLRDIASFYQDEHVTVAMAERHIAAALRAAVAVERERIAAAVRALGYDEAEMLARNNGDEHYAEAGYDQAIGHILGILAAGKWRLTNVYHLC